MNRFINLIAGVAVIVIGSVAFASGRIEIWNHSFDFSLLRWFFTPICLIQGFMLIRCSLKKKERSEENELSE